jgi:uncharacterized protein YdhG (YjbR/CyaY superfamily)
VILSHEFWPNHALQRTRHGVVVSNRCVSRAGSLSLGRSATTRYSQTIHGFDMKKPKTIDEYILSFPSEVQAILERIRRTIRRAAPGAQEAISYQMPSFRLHRALVYFAAWKKHIGIYPPVSGDHKLERAVAPYAGEKGNLQFPLDRPIPYELIEQIVKLRVRQDRAKAESTQRKRRRPARHEVTKT